MLDMYIEDDGIQTLFNILTEMMEYNGQMTVGFNNVGWCCTMLTSWIHLASTT